jgi:hypothetical protein
MLQIKELLKPELKGKKRRFNRYDEYNKMISEIS